jgi:hypothetical protein
MKPRTVSIKANLDSAKAAIEAAKNDRQPQKELIEVKTIVDQFENRQIAKEIYHEIEGFVIHITIEAIGVETLRPYMNVKISKVSDKRNQFAVNIHEDYKGKIKGSISNSKHDYYSSCTTDSRTPEQWSNVCKFAKHAKGLLETLKEIESL